MDNPRTHSTTYQEIGVPAYRSDTLSAVTPSLAAALGVPGHDDQLGVGPARAAAFLLVDGLGAELLARHFEKAPTLTELARRGSVLRAGFPATTASSLASLGTGLPSGEHGIVGYSFALDGTEEVPPVLNALGWCAHASPKEFTDLRKDFPPESIQPQRTVFESAAADGVEVVRLVPDFHIGSGMSRAVLRGPGHFRATAGPEELVPGMLGALGGPGRTFVYGYHRDLDTIGHMHGPGSKAWIEELGRVDALVADLASGMPPGTVLAVVADHGMIDTGDHRVDLEHDPDLLHGVRVLGGESRVRHVHTEPGAASDVLAAWREVLGERAWVVERDRAVAEGWYGPHVPDRIRGRLGDVIAAARRTWTLLRPQGEPLESAMIGHHGSWTEEEQLVPLLFLRPE